MLQLELRGDQRSVRWGAAAAAPAGAAAAAAPTAAAAAQQRQWDQGFSCLVGCPGLHTVQDLVVLMRTLNRMERETLPTPAARRGALLRALFGSDSVALPALLGSLVGSWKPKGTDEAGELLRVVVAAYQALPREWVTAAAAGLPPVTQPQRRLGMGRRVDAAAVQEAVGQLSGVLGWGKVSLCPPPEGSKLAAMSVKAATLLQLGPRLAAQQRARAEYVASALAAGAGAAAPAAAVQAGVRGLQAAMAGLWGLSWDNRRREILWRLSVNGVRGAGGHGVAMRGPCKCGWAGPPAGLAKDAASQEWRLHHFWSCPVATAVVAELQSALPAGCAPLTCANVWLLREPAGLHPGVWGVVCAAALEAMERGRRALWAVGETRLEEGQTRITDYFLRAAPPGGAAAATTPAATAVVWPAAAAGPLAPGAAAGVAAAQAAAVERGVRRAQRRAAAWVWCILQDFAFLQGGCDEDGGLWAQWANLPQDHPFFFFAVGERLQLRLPPGLVLPADI